MNKEKAKEFYLKWDGIQDEIPLTVTFHDMDSLYYLMASFLEKQQELNMPDKYKDILTTKGTSIIVERKNRL